MAREDIYKVARALSRDTSLNSKRLPKYPPYQHELNDITKARGIENGPFICCRSEEFS